MHRAVFFCLFFVTLIPAERVLPEDIPDNHLVNWTTEAQYFEHVNPVSWTPDAEVMQKILTHTFNQSFTFPFAPPAFARIRNSDYIMSVALKNVSMDEMKGITIKPVEATSASEVVFQVNMSEWPVIEFDVVATYAKLPSKVPVVNWDFYAWEWNLTKRPQHTIHLKTAIDVSRFQSKVVVHLPLYKCVGNAIERLGCLMQSPTEYLKAVLSSNLEYHLKRIVEMKVLKMTWKFQADKAIEYDAQATYVNPVTEHPIFRTSNEEKQDLVAHAREVVETWMITGIHDSIYLQDVQESLQAAINLSLDEILDEYQN